MKNIENKRYISRETLAILQNVHSPKSGNKSPKVSSQAVSRMVLSLFEEELEVIGSVSDVNSRNLSRICSQAFVSCSSVMSKSSVFRILPTTSAIGLSS